MRGFKQIGVLCVATIFLANGAIFADAFNDSPGRFTGALTTADACGAGTGNFGVFAGLGDDVTSVFGSFGYGFSKYTEGRIKIGFTDPKGKNDNLRFADTEDRNSDMGFLIGMDLKHEYLDYYDKSSNVPFDLAFGGMLEYAHSEGSSIFELGGNVIGSIPYRFNSGNRLVPYILLNLRMESFSNNGTDLEGGLNLGTKFEFRGDINLFAEFQIFDNMTFFTGLEFGAF
jgi:hypothetical protein